MEAQEQQQQFYPMPQPSFSHTSEGALHYQIDPEEIIENVRHILKSEEAVIDTKTNQYVWRVPNNVKPLITDNGINKVMAILKTRLTKIFILSDIDYEQIERMTVAVGVNIVTDIYLNWENYEISSEADAQLILELCCDTIFGTLNKGRDGKYLRFLQTTSRIQDIQQHTINGKGGEGSQGQSTGIVDWLLRRKK